MHPWLAYSIQVPLSCGMWLLQQYKRLTAVDSALSLAERIALICAYFGVPVAGVVALIAAFTSWFWDQYGLLGVAGVALISFLIASLGIAAIAYAADRLETREGAPGDPAEPSKTINLYQLMPLVTEVATASYHTSRPDIGNRIYDALRKGTLKAWGRESYEFPIRDVHPAPVRVFIAPSFWKRNTIVGLDKWITDGQLLGKYEDASITLPDAGYDRAKATCYWDIAFDPDDTETLWPPKRSWMSA